MKKKENRRSDPTIKAMLNMLDLIYARLDNKTDLETLIKNLDKITFYAFDMGEFSLGEELYIKMNARGKQLSHYENLKAYIESNPKIAEDYTLLASIDNKWADMFFTPNNISAFDKRGIVFLHYANVFFILLNDEIKSGDIKPMIESASHAIDEFYKPLQDLENIMLLDNLVDLYKDYNEAFIKSGFLRFSDFKSFKNSEDFLDITGTDIYYFYAALFFIIASKGKNINSQALEDYLRVCKHFIENHRRDNPDEHISAFFNLFKILSKGYKNIYEFLTQNPTHSFHSNMYALESHKAKLILQSRNGGDKWEEILNKTSNHRVLMGWVDYLLDFSHSDSYENPNFDKFCKYAEITMHIFDEIQKEKDRKQNNDFLPLFQRAFLSIGNYGFWDTNFFYGNYCGYSGFRYHRESWNWLLGGTKNEAKEPYFKTFLDLLLESKADNLDSKMREIIARCDLSQKKWWEQLLICQDELFKFLVKDKPQNSSITRIRFWNELPKVELLLRKKNIKNVRDLLDYGFYLYCKDKEIQNLSEYTSDEEQYGNYYPLQSHFTINNKEVLCDSMNAKITFGKQEFSIDMDGDIFAEFDKVLDLIKS